MDKLITSPEAKFNESALYCFVKEVNVKTLTKSTVSVFADARYKMYINGTLTAIGPCKHSSEIKYYDVLDITKYLKCGINKIEVQVLQLPNNIYSEKNALLECVARSGNIALYICGNAGDAPLETNQSWLVAKETGVEFFGDTFFEFYNVASLAEKISANYKKNLSFTKAAELDKIYRLEEEKGMTSLLSVPARKRPIPMMYFNKTNFLSSFENVYDAGKLTCGFLRFNFSGKGTVRITYAESMAFIENGKLKKRKRDDMSGVIVGNYDIVEIDGNCSFQPFWMRTFRYVKLEITGNVKTEGADYLETGYPLCVSDKYDFGNETDNKLFEISVNTLKRCMHETYVDCPYYEQLQYTADTHLQILFTYQLTNDKALAEKAIDDFAESFRPGGLTQSRYPTIKAQYIPGFSLIFILMLYEHYMRFGNKSFLKKYIHVADGVLSWFICRLDGHMVTKSNLWDFIDWADEFDGGQIPTDKPNAIYSLMLAYAIEKTIEMHSALKNNTEELSKLPYLIKKDVKERCFNEKNGLYADSPEKAHFSQHTQIWAVLCGMEEGENARKILEKSSRLKTLATSSYLFFLFRALEKADMYNEAFKYINSLRGLIALGCTTTPEVVNEDVRSECHAWSAVAIYEFTAKILGLTYKNGCIQIKPYTKERNFAKGEVAIPNGTVYCEWKKENNIFKIKINIPENEKAILTLPDNTVINAKSGEYSCKIQ